MKHLLPYLPYDVSALEPHIDARTMVVHHEMHHAAYVNALNLALESAPESLQRQPASWLLRNLRQVPANLQTAIRNNAGGHVNHSLLWRAMSPDGGGAPTGALAASIEQAFSSFEKFKGQFSDAGATLFGSGWVWLVNTRRGNAGLKLVTTTGHDNPMTKGQFPILLNDVWEHAYYLNHENRRLDYLQGWWSIVNWKEASRRFDRSERVATAASEVDIQPAGDVVV